MKKFLVILLVLLIASGGAAGFAWSKRVSIVTGRIQADLTKLAGVDAIVTGIKVEAAAPLARVLQVKIDKIKLKNPPNYKIPNMVLIRNIRLTAETVPFLLGQWKIKDLEAFIKRAALQVNAEGAMNLTAIPVFQSPSQNFGKNFEIGKLQLKFGKLYYFDFKDPAKPERQIKDLKGKVEFFENVRSPAVFFQVPVLKMMDEFNRGSFGLPRGQMMESLKSNVGSQANP